MAPTPCKLPPSSLQQAPQAGAKGRCLLPSPGEQTSGALEDLDSYIDFSLESLNQMILELDPTFQLLPPGPGGPWAEPTQSVTSRRKKEEAEALGPSRDMQPTMKFVMDTSKYWFKPSITREQAIELLRKEEPGTFIVRDSSSYRGSFGLALKVPEAPVPAQNRSAFHMALALPCKLVIPQKGGAGPLTCLFSVERIGSGETGPQTLCGMAGPPVRRNLRVAESTASSRIFGFVAKSQTESQENVCHLFAEYDAAQPASQVIGLVGALLQDPERM
ncbi:Tensin-4 [Camelus dromedarius]|uniref:Tensin-4 n=1 Tax=Camelus dromedarius TaxID=9838 RepID=A0A5N4D3B9_CAMDR|nr:Tensin-4 [Camelus dromedarius]